VIENSCRAIAKLQNAHQKKYRISINTSSYELTETGYIDFLISTIRKYNISPEYVEIEITERIMLELNDAVYAKISMIKDLGIRIALDDFGIGLSSIQNLKKVSFDTVKIDKEFVQVLDKNTIDVKILTSIVDMLNVFGVDTKAQFTNVFKNRIKTIQGFYTGSPQDVYTLLKKYQPK
jgi:EAL domain-containing protein (putative c-di-GMP-specific phosphodiesterase class I)